MSEPRIYINSDEVKILPMEGIEVELQFYNGEIISGVEPRKLFPLSGSVKYITLIDRSGTERAVIRNLDLLDRRSKETILHALNEYYLVPQILQLIDSTEVFGNLKWTVLTDRGEYTFDIRNRHSDIKVLYDGRILIRDSNDNRYEIKDYKKLDRKSLQYLISET